MRFLASILALSLFSLAAPLPAASGQSDEEGARPTEKGEEGVRSGEQPSKEEPASETDSSQSGQTIEPPPTNDPEALGAWIQENVGAGSGEETDAGTDADSGGDPQSEASAEFEQIVGAAQDGDVDQLVTLLGPYLLTVLFKVLVVIGILVAALFLGAWVRRVLRRGLIKIRVEQTIAQFLGNIARWGILLIALLMCLDRFGINVTSLAALLGAAALTIGLAFQGALSNIAAGVMLLIFRPFKVNEWVELDGELGVVEEIDLFYTHINQFDNRHIVLPNSKVLEGKIESLTHNPVRRVHLPVGVAYDTDLVMCEDVLLKAAHDPDEALDDREPMIVLTEFGDSSINWEVRVWCRSDRFMALRHQLIHAIAARFREADITIPFPQRDLNTNRPLRVALERDDVEAGD